MEKEKPLLSIRNLKKVFKTRDGEIEALANVSFDVHPGEFVSIVGPSGCGKSTVLKIVAGLIAKSSGEIDVDERQFDPTSEVGFVFQTASLLQWRKVLDNVLLPIEILKNDRNSMIAKAKDLLELVGLQDFIESYPNELSG